MTVSYVSVKIETVLSSYVRCEVCMTIRFQTMLNRLAREIHQQILTVYGETCMSIQMVYRYIKYYQQGYVKYTMHQAVVDQLE